MTLDPDPPESTEVPVTSPDEVTEDPPPPRQKIPRSEKQLQALQAAREKALRIRQERADLTRKEKEIARAQQEREKSDRAAKIQSEYDALQKKEDEPEPPPKRARKPARRIIVHEASSGEESEDDTVDVILPPKPKQPTAEQLRLQRSMDKMFSFQP